MPEKISIFRYATPGGKAFYLCMLLVTVYAVAVTWIDNHAFPVRQLLKAEDTMGLGVVIGLLFVFRINSSYERWWEGRKLWGQLVNDLRNLSIKARELALIDPEESLLFSQLLTGFAKSLKDHLRGTENHEYIPELYRHELESVKHVPLTIARLVYKRIRTWNRVGKLSDIDMLQLDSHARGLMDVCGACERIMKSPISGTYKVVFRFGIVLFAIFTPWLLVPENHQLTTIMTILSIYFVIALEFLAIELEHPFGTSINDLPLESICDTIDSSVKEILN